MYTNSEEFLSDHPWIVKQALQGKKCPYCHKAYVYCDIPDCYEFAQYEGWISNGSMLQRRHVCREHAKLTEGYKAKGEAIFKEAKE